MSQQCTNLEGDRSLGAFWERKFGTLAAKYGHVITANQINRTGSAVAHYLSDDGNYRTLILPDLVIWSFPGQHHEIKHKSPAKTGARRGCYGLERYRFDSLKHFQSVCGQRVFYTIHDHEQAGGKHVKDNRLEDWVSLSISDMDGTHDHAETGVSWCNGSPIETEIMYWHQSLFAPLASVLDGEWEKTVLPTNVMYLQLGETQAQVERLRADLADEKRRQNALTGKLRSVPKLRGRYSAPRQTALDLEPAA